MTKHKIKSRERSSSGSVLDESSVDEVRDRLEGLLPEEALQDALAGLGAEQITGPGGLMTQLAGRVLEAALGAELTGHLGYPPGQGPPGGAGNHRNGHTAKTVKTELGEVAIRSPRDRQGTFEPRLVAKRQTRLAGLDERVLDLYAGGMSTRDIAAHLQRLYGVEIGRDTISRVTDAVLEDIAAWRARPLEAVYPIVYFDALMVKVTEDRSVRTRACYLAVGVTVDGDREALGIWWQDIEGAKFWLAVLNDLARRGVRDVLIACVDGLTGFPDAIDAVFPRDLGADLHRASDPLLDALRQLPGPPSRWPRTCAPSTPPPNADAALTELERFDEAWGARYPMIADAWRSRWEHITPFLSLPEELRRIVYTTNTIEAMHRHIRKAIKTRGHFPDEQAATKLIYLAIERAETKWRSARAWTTARRALKIHFADRFPD